MAQHSSLHKFLDTHKADGKSTHTSMQGGSYFIGDDEMDLFYDLYFKALRRHDKQFLVEKSTPVGPCRVDFDFIYAKDVTKHLHTRDQVMSFSRAYIECIKELVQVPDDVRVYVMEKDEPTYNKKKDAMKSGIHFLFPDIKVHKCVEQRVRRALIGRMEEFFAGLPLQDAWDTVYDEAIVNRSAPWTLYGSQKPETIDAHAVPYRLTYILNWDGADFNVTEGRDLPTESVDLIKTLSIRRRDDEQTPYTEEGHKLYESFKSSGQDTSKRTHRGRPMERTQRPNSRASSPTAIMTQPLEPDERNTIREHVMNLNPRRADEYADWIKVGQCLYNIHPDLLDVFLDFSSQNADKYNEGDCVRTWNGFTFRNDGDKLSYGSLRYWSRDDNPEAFEDINERNVQRLMKVACSLTEYDCAALIHALFRDNYKCSDFKYNIWYRWSGHIWRETDSGVDLLLRLSKEVAQKFYKKAAVIQNEMANSNLLDCLDPERMKECGKCDYCVLELERTGYEKVYKQLKKTGFKANVMRECRELFFDEEFAKKADANKDLIAFNNGVLELDDKFTFRPGKPSDYMTFSTGIDYDVDKPYYEYASWQQVERFIRQVLADAEVREYFMKHLASNLFGGNPAQKFHVMTGSGSNGKSMIMNLMSKAMGDYACTVPISLLTQQRKSSGSAAPEVARLKGRRFVTMQEPDERIALNTGLMKEISSGEKMYARDLFKSGGEFEVLAKFHLACNEKPKINTTDGGTWRRLVVINFTSKFVVTPMEPHEYPLDESIQFSVGSVEWATAFMAYLVHVLKEGRGLRKLSAPDKVLEYTNDYRDENDAIAKFIREKIVAAGEGDDVQTTKDTIRRTFRQWKADNDNMSLQPIELEKRLIAVYGVYPRGGWRTFKIADS